MKANDQRLLTSVPSLVLRRTRPERQTATAARLLTVGAKLHNLADGHRRIVFECLTGTTCGISWQSHATAALSPRRKPVNQSTVHRRLDELERRLGRQLVVRQPTGYKLTELGQDLLTYAERVEETVHSFERRLAASDTSLAGSVKLTCPVAIGVRLLHSPFIKKFGERYPNLRVEFVINDKLLDLAKGEADIAIRATAPFDDALFGRKIAETPWAIYASTSYIERAGTITDVADIARHSVALYDLEQEHVTKTWMQSVAPQARVAARCDSLTSLRSAAKSGVGLAALPHGCRG